MDLTISFFGGAGTVTGSKYLLETPRYRALVGCGLFQGLKQQRLRNWAPFPVPPNTIDSVILTHARLDHSGYLPALIRTGYAGRIHCSPATRDLCGIHLPDSGHLQEMDAEYANRHGFSKHKPALPLYTPSDAERAMEHFQRICEAQGGMWVPPVAHQRRPILASRSGRMDVLDNRKLAKLVKLAGAPDAKAAGLEMHFRLGDGVRAGEPLFTVHAETRGELGYAFEYSVANEDIVGIGES